MKKLVLFVALILIIFRTTAVPCFADNGGLEFSAPGYSITEVKHPDDDSMFRVIKVYSGQDSDSSYDSVLRGRSISFDYELRVFSLESLQKQAPPDIILKGQAEISADADYVDIDAKPALDWKKLNAELGANVCLLIDEKSIKGADEIADNDMSLFFMSDSMTKYLEQGEKLQQNAIGGPGNTEDIIKETGPAELEEIGADSEPTNFSSILQANFKFIAVAVLVFLGIVIIVCFAVWKSIINKRKHI